MKYKKFITFGNAKEMLDFVNNDHDLYCEMTNAYVANYTANGGIVVYYLDEDDVRECEKYRTETGDYWLGCLGPGGDIYDDPSHHNFTLDQMSNLDFCEQNYKKLWSVIC